VTIEGTSGGVDAEEHARRIASVLGVPDFVYRPLREQKGMAQREISDGLLICGDEGLILQVKSRQASEPDTLERAERWIVKHAQAAHRQADGTRRRLEESRAVIFTSLRGYTRTLTGIEGWPAVVILQNLAGPAGLRLPHSADTLWITLEDWRALHAHLRSTAAVIAYVKRALASGLRPALGDEAERYLTLASADAQAHGGPSSYPMLPMGVLDEPEATYAAIIDDLIEKVWPQDGPIPWHDPDEYRLIVERLDRIPPAIRASLGLKIVKTLEAAIDSGARRSFTLCDTSQDARLLFVCDILKPGEREDRLMAEIALLATVRQHQALDSGADRGSVTLTVGILHCADRGRQYAFAHIGTPPPEVSDELRRQVERDYGVLRGRSITVVEDAPAK
jgi:hypothetical protein